MRANAANLRSSILYHANPPEKAVLERLTNTLLALFYQVSEPNFWVTWVGLLLVGTKHNAFKLCLWSFMSYSLPTNCTEIGYKVTCALDPLHSWKCNVLLFCCIFYAKIHEIWPHECNEFYMTVSNLLYFASSSPGK